jgi:hypothetical protein
MTQFRPSERFQSKASQSCRFVVLFRVASASLAVTANAGNAAAKEKSLLLSPSSDDSLMDYIRRQECAGCALWFRMMPCDI